MNDIIEVTNKTPIELALKIDDEGMTTARKLFEWLADEKNYSRWLEKNITGNVFAENEFFTISSKTSSKGGRPMENYRITASLAKRISMTSKTERGEEARQYFIGCEQMLVKVMEANRRTEIERAKGIAVRQALTKALQQSTESERMHGHAYSTYTNCIYKALFNKNAKQLREEYGIDKKSDLRSCFSEEQLKAIKSMEMLVSGLVDCGWDYDKIKSFIQQTNTKLIAN